MNIIDDLQWRGAIHQQTDEAGLRALLDQQKIAVYCGVDPTGDSMHIGHLIPFMILRRFQLAGHRPIILIGGATGSIGDPSGRTSERTLQSPETIEHNVRKLSAQMRRLFVTNAADEQTVLLCNNNDWTHSLTLLEFLRDYGKLFNVNTMIAKDVVASRLATGISFTEFTYQILQSMDFLHLYQEKQVQLQIGGADQWGNITAGLDLIRKKCGPEAAAFGLTIPLMVKADGTKFGKSAGDAIWLDAEKTSPYVFYQFWLNQDDRDVVKYLKYFTFLSKEELNVYEQQVADEPHLRAAQRRLAEEVTRFVHGDEALADAQRISQALFSGNIKDLSAKDIYEGFKNMPTVHSSKTPCNLANWLVDLGIEPSRRQAREDIANGALSLNGDKITDSAYELVPVRDSFDGRYIIIRRGKKNYFLVVLDDETTV